MVFQVNINPKVSYLQLLSIDVDVDIWKIRIFRPVGSKEKSHVLKFRTFVRVSRIPTFW